jgi:hypothetical protein
MSVARERGAEVDARLVSASREQGVSDQRIDEAVPSCRQTPGDRRRRPEDPGLVVRGGPAWACGMRRETGEDALKPSEGDEPNREPDDDVQECRTDDQVPVGTRETDDANDRVDRSPR